MWEWGGATRPLDRVVRVDVLVVRSAATGRTASAPVCPILGMYYCQRCKFSAASVCFLFHKWLSTCFGLKMPSRCYVFGCNGGYDSCKEKVSLYKLKTEQERVL